MTDQNCPPLAPASGKQPVDPDLAKLQALLSLQLPVRKEPELSPQRQLEWQAEQMLLWVLADNVGRPAEELAPLGLSEEALALLRQEHAEEIAGYMLLQRAGDMLTRERLGKLLVSRLGGMALAARTPAEYAAVTRAARTLPDWAWQAGLMAADGPAQERLAAAREAAGRTGGAASGAQQAMQPLNRAERRRLEALERKGQ
jgi:hypothetical protein